VTRGQQDDLYVVELVDAPTAAEPVLIPTDRTGPTTHPVGRRHLWAAVAALIAGAAVAGFVTGRSGRPDASGPTAQQQVVSIAPNGVIGGTGRRCAVRMGRDVQLGVEAENLGPDAVQLIRLDVVVPSLEVRQIGIRVGACAQLGEGQPVAGTTIGPLGTLWVSIILSVTAQCPRGSAVEFRLTYMQAGQQESSKIFAVADLGPVPYDSCAAAT
jgi:hypothetical protein